MARRGENIFRRKDGRWEARYIHHYENGRAKYRYIYGTSYVEVKAKKQAEQALPENSAVHHVKQLATFEQLAYVWLADTKITVKESTYTRYHRIVRLYLFPHLGSQSVSKIDVAFLRGLPEKLLTEGGIERTPLAPKTVSDILCVLKSIFQYGKNHAYPCPEPSLLHYPQKKSKSIKILTEENRMKLEKLLLSSEDTTSLGILFTMFTGVRIGELCGLRWEDVDFHSLTVHISRTVERIADLDPEVDSRTKVVVSEPKTENSFREIPLPRFLAEYLSMRKRGPECYLLTGNRRHTEPHQFYIRYQKYLKQHGIENYSFHALRHTFATRCVEMGFDTKSLAEILGHSNINTTLSVYVHPSIQQKKTQMERLTPSHANFCEQQAE